MQSPYYKEPRKDRFLIEFSAYALEDVPDVWKRERTPVKYAPIDVLGSDPSTLTWKPMPPREAAATTDADKQTEAIKNTGTTRALTMAEAKKGLALA